MPSETPSAPNVHFGKEYVGYWKDRVVTAPDGTPTSTPKALESCLPGLDLKDGQTVVDLGCGFGRMFRLLEGAGRTVVGVDLSPEMIDAAASLPYSTLLRGTVEDTRLPSGWVDRILCWATFDVAEQEDGFREIHRILKPGGRILLTGKNDSYLPDDEPALVAERNAFLKGFPNHFTDVDLILGSCGTWGFEARHAWGYLRRGDMGGDHRFELDGSGPRDFYEYALILEKTDATGTVPKLCDPHSRTIREIWASRSGGEDLPTFLALHKERHGESFPPSEETLA